MERFDPTLNDGSHIFVFGSNLGGRHGKGAALEAKNHWGAVCGVGSGSRGQSYAIPTKDRRLRTLPLRLIGGYIDMFCLYASYYPELTFLVTAVGCGLAGFAIEDILPFWKNAPPNCVFAWDDADYGMQRSNRPD
jgi:hypothetical protein